MIKAVSIDDEINALGIIEQYIHESSGIQLIRSFTDPVEGLQYIQGNAEIDLVFLDIQMASLNGMELARRLPAQVRVIITSAYADFALEGYELDFIDYLLKPFTFSRFNRAIQKFKAYHESASLSGSKTAMVPRIMPASDDIVFIKTEYKTIKLHLSEIRYIEGAGNYVAIHLENSKILTLQKLGAFEEYLAPYFFLRVHKSYIISLKHLDSIEGNYLNIGRSKIPIGDSYKEALNKLVSDYSKLL
ncbi:MAG: LytTR family DNA-binding domain-containing protein [Chitinophagaceae bacterium]|nr:LytTR family DNA-binding domain-containing protein [Chitinophagaceae bacterium]